MSYVIALRSTLKKLKALQVENVKLKEALKWALTQADENAADIRNHWSHMFLDDAIEIEKKIAAYRKEFDL